LAKKAPFSTQQEGLSPQLESWGYYAHRAPHYDTLYTKPERQPDLAHLRAYLQTALAGRNVLEIACGTGYWTQAFAQTARSVLATDLNETMLEVARQKDYPPGKVLFEARDMYTLQRSDEFDALFAGFIWSHIPLEQLEKWLDHLHGLLKPGSTFIFMDNHFVEGSSTPIAATDGQGNTYQTRTLPDGTQYQIIKNFPGRQDFERLLQGRGWNIQVENLKYYWVLQYTNGQ
jgi:demethylmenaquinone methyltransferase/2-methoxy-6-polyprenyl-1,4-benzoquinol methylase